MTEQNQITRKRCSKCHNCGGYTKPFVTKGGAIRHVRYVCDCAVGLRHLGVYSGATAGLRYTWSLWR